MIQLRTHFLILKPAEFRDYEKEDQIVKWLNNKEHMQYSEQRHKTHTRMGQYEYRQSHDQKNRLLWDIHLNDEDQQFIGTITAYVDEPNQRAEMGILIGPEYAKMGYGLEAWKLVMRYLFTRVQRVFAGMMVSNRAMRTVALRSGMSDIGRIPDYFILNGELEECVFYRRDR